MYIIGFKYFINQGNLLHCFISLQFEFCMIEIDQLIAKPVNVATETSLAWKHILIVIDILVKERPVL